MTNTVTESFRDMLTAKPTVFGPATDADRAARLNQWVERHNRIVRAHNLRTGGTRAEQNILNLGQAIHGIVTATDWENEGFLDQYVYDLITGFRGLLNGDIGNLDGGTLDSFACAMAEAIGWDLVTDERVQRDSHTRTLRT